MLSPSLESNASFAARLSSAADLAAVDERFLVMASQAPFMIWISSAIGALTYANPRWLEFRGRCAIEELVDGYQEGIHESDIDKFIQDFTHAHAAKSEIKTSFRLRRNDGKFQRMNFSGAPLTDANGKFTGLIGTCTEITDELVVEVTAGQSYPSGHSGLSSASQQGRTNKDLVPTMAHDLKTPLIAASTVMRHMLAGDYGEVTSEQSRILNALKSSLDQSLDQIKNLLDFYKFSEGGLKVDRQQVDVGALILQSIASAQSLAIEKPQITASIDADVPKLTGDEGALHRVLANLLDNAIKYTPINGKIEVIAEKAGHSVMVNVRDTGYGILPEEQTHVFDRFWRGQTGTRVTSGNGLGLYVCKQIVEAHGGTISCMSSNSAGTTFTVLLPIN